MSRSAGSCNTMGTASTMASMAEALGMPCRGMRPYRPSMRAGASRHICQGRRIIEMVHEDLVMSRIATREAFENAIRVNGAIGGSTMGAAPACHCRPYRGRSLTGRLGRLGRGIPTIVNLKPSGTHLMEDFFAAGGLPVVLRALCEAGLLHRDCLTVTGRSLWQNNLDAENFKQDVIRPLSNPLAAEGGIAVLRAIWFRAAAC